MTELEALKLVHEASYTALVHLAQLGAADAAVKEAHNRLAAAQTLVENLIQRVQQADKHYDTARDLVDETLADFGVVIIDTLAADTIRERLTDLERDDLADSLSNEVIVDQVRICLSDGEMPVVYGEWMSDLEWEVAQALVKANAPAPAA